jgi:hypothetical protein
MLISCIYIVSHTNCVLKIHQTMIKPHAIFITLKKAPSLHYTIIFLLFYIFSLIPAYNFPLHGAICPNSQTIFSVSRSLALSWIENCNDMLNNRKQFMCIVMWFVIILSLLRWNNILYDYYLIRTYIVKHWKNYDRENVIWESLRMNFKLSLSILFFSIRHDISSQFFSNDFSLFHER